MIIGFGVHLAIKMLLLILAVTHTARISSQLVLWHQGRFLPKAGKQVNTGNRSTEKKGLYNRALTVDFSYTAAVYPY
jgi:hypothetical protein